MRSTRVTQSIHAQLLIAETETGKQNALLIRAAITVGVAQILDVRRGSDQHPAFPRQHAVGKRQFVCEHRRSFVAAIAGTVFEEPDSARRSRVGIIEHLCNEEPHIRIEGDGDGTDYIWLGGHQFNRQRRVGQVEGDLFLFW